MRQTEPNPMPMFGSPIGPWHDWFAWKPVRTYDERLVWFRWVRRRNIQLHSYLPSRGPDRWWQYHCEAA